jgi:hypothetical protein
MTTTDMDTDIARIGVSATDRILLKTLLWGKRNGPVPGGSPLFQELLSLQRRCTWLTTKLLP